MSVSTLPALSDSALVIVGHGSTLNPDSSAPTYDHARTISEKGIFREVHTCYWKEEPSMREVLWMVESEEVFIVPNFISEGYFTQTVIPRELNLTGPVTERDGKVIRYCQPVGSHPHMTDALLHRAREVAPAYRLRKPACLLSAMGPTSTTTRPKPPKTRCA